MKANPTSLSSNHSHGHVHDNTFDKRPPKSIPCLKVCVMGASGLGKTTWVKRLMTGDFEGRHIPTLGVEVHPLSLQTNEGMVTFNLWDVAGLDKYRGLGDAYFLQAQGGILFLTSDVRDNKRRLHEFRRITSETTPVVCVIPQCDTPKSKEYGLAEHGMRSFASTHGLPIYPMSAKSNYNFEKPLLSIARTCFNAPALHFGEVPSVVATPKL
jgi:GTP-binding nuclear protein Ran